MVNRVPRPEDKRQISQRQKVSMMVMLHPPPPYHLLNPLSCYYALVLWLRTPVLQTPMLKTPVLKTPHVENPCIENYVNFL